MFAGAFMMGAKDRLLPPSVPFRFFATALVYHVLGWAFLVADYKDLADFSGGFGASLAGLHLITLGVLAMVAMGAAFQMLPVATRRQLGPVWACRLTWWLFAPGVAVLALGFLTLSPWFLHPGMLLVVAGLGLFGLLVAQNLMQVADLPQMTRHAWIAVVSLFALMGLGVVLVIDARLGFLDNRASVVVAHAGVAGLGFMGNLALGFSHVLVPMFLLAQTPKAGPATVSAGLMALSLALGPVGMLTGWMPLSLISALAVLVAVGVHLYSMAGVVRARMKKRFESFFRLVWLGWGMALAGPVLALAAQFWNGLTGVWGWVMIFGWLLSFVTAVLQRIMPFLASMHSGGKGGKPVLMSHLVAELPLTLHLVGHGLALVLVALSMILTMPALALAGSLSGLAGALALGCFAFLLMQRYRAHESAANKD